MTERAPMLPVWMLEAIVTTGGVILIGVLCVVAGYLAAVEDNATARAYDEVHWHCVPANHGGSE